MFGECAFPFLKFEYMAHCSQTSLYRKLVTFKQIRAFAYSLCYACQHSVGLRILLFVGPTNTSMQEWRKLHVSFRVVTSDEQT